MKPSWDDAPEWAQWLAMDECGAWYWFECLPVQGRNTWHPDGGHYERAGWKQSLEARP